MFSEITGKDLVFMVVWAVLMGYSAVAIFVPEIRIFWRHENFKLGALSSVGLASFFWWPVVAAVVVPQWPAFAKYFIGLVLFIGFCFAGYVIDKASN